MTLQENDPRGRSVEHLIPNAVLTVSRTKGDGDFYACRECNSAKSKLDDILATLAKAQAPNPHVAARALIKAISSDKGSSKRFVEMVRGAQHMSDGVHMTMPVNGRELYDYISYLAKGCHFLTRGVVLDATHVVLQEFVGKAVLASLHEAYFGAHGTNPVLDLTQNPLSKSWGNGQVVLWSRESDHLLVLHWYVGIIMQVRPRTRRNYREARRLEVAMLRDFATAKVRRASATRRRH